jgi:peroxiredoxin Q/BCP
VRQAGEALARAGIAAVGISPDAPKTQRKFDAERGLGSPLFADEDHRTTEAYGARGERSMYSEKCMGIIRSSFPIDESGKIIEAGEKARPAGTASRALEAVGE